MPKVSVVIPVYNVGRFLQGCIDSAINQSLKDIEIICVNDASTDGCLSILQSCAEKDQRIKVINFKNNLGTSQARKAGVLASTGDYVMFLDGDDEFFPNACELAYNSIVKYKTDIVQFDTEIINDAGVPEQRIKMNKKLLAPYLAKVIKDCDLVEKVWKEKLFGFSLWNKIFLGSICRAAFSEVLDGYYPKGQDLYAFFIIAHLSKSYAGIKDVLYKYKFGTGITGGDVLTVEKYGTLVQERNVYVALTDYVSKNSLDTYRDITTVIYNNFINECVSKWANNLSIDSLSEGFRQLVDVWGVADVIKFMASKYWYDCRDLAKKLRYVDYIRHTPLKRKKKRLTVAIVYRCIVNGGAQRVTADLCNIWSSATDVNGKPLFNVVLITDSAPGENEYPLNSNVKREFLPPIETSVKEKYAARYDAWQRILDQNDIDVVVSGLWVAPCTFWDMLAVKTHPSKPAFTVHSHSFCAVPYGFESGITGIRNQLTYELCDGVVTLSECDREYTEAFSNNVAFINNPVFVDPMVTENSEYLPNVIVWVGRISPEKNPLDIIRMMSLLIKKVPEAKLYMVGTGDQKLMSEMSALIENMGLAENIKTVGFDLDVGKYYSKASVMILSSKYEGFPLTLCEAKAYALPIVMYDLPWLTFVQDGRGILTVEQNHYERLAEKVEYLLKNPQDAQKIGQLGKEELIELYQKHDILRDWRTFFDKAVQSNGVPSDNKNNESIILRYISNFQYEGRKLSENKSRRQLNEAKTKYDRQLNEAKTKYDRQLNEAKTKYDRQLNDYSKMIARKTSAYLELKTSGMGNSLDIVPNKNEKVSRATWYDDKLGLGYRITGYNFAIDIDVVCHGSGVLKVICRGLDVRAPGNAKTRIPIWVIFTSLNIDGVEYINHPVDVWHNKPHHCDLQIEDGQLVHIRAEWVPQTPSLSRWFRGALQQKKTH